MAVGVDTDRGPLFYLGVLFSDGFPWALMLFPAAALWWRQRPAPSRIQLLFFIWILAITAFFSFSASKQDLYIYPVMPAIAALGGVAIAANAPGARWLGALIAALFALAGAGVLYVFQRNANVYELEGIVPVAVVAILGGLAALGLSLIGRWHKGLLAFLAAGVLVNWILVLRVLPSFEKYKPVPPIARFLEARLQPGDVVAHYSVALPSMVYYMRRHLDVTYGRERFLEIMRQPARVYAVLWTEEYERVREDIGVPTCPVFRTPAFNIKLGAIIRQERLPEVMVITNRCEN